MGQLHIASLTSDFSITPQFLRELSTSYHKDWHPSALPAHPSASKVERMVVERIALPPASLTPVPLASVLPDDVAVSYSSPNNLLRDVSERDKILATLGPVRQFTRACTKLDYTSLLSRLHSLDMVKWLPAPPTVQNAVFCVKKTDASLRLIGDLRWANAHFQTPPHVSLANLDAIAALEVDNSAQESISTVRLCKWDLSNFYHYLLTNPSFWPYFGLTPMRVCDLPPELHHLGDPLDWVYPSLPRLVMGWSHAVFLAQTAHVHMLTASGILQDSLRLSTAALRSVVLRSASYVWSLVIDDVFLIGSWRVLRPLVLAAFAMYKRIGLEVKPSKTVLNATRMDVIGGSLVVYSGGLSLVPQTSKLSKLLQLTSAILSAPSVSSEQLACLIGGWSFLFLIRRCFFSLLFHSYRFVVRFWSSDSSHRLWSSVRAELGHLLCLWPLLSANLSASFDSCVLNFDASSYGLGGAVLRLSDVATVLPTAREWGIRHVSLPLCSGMPLAPVPLVPVLLSSAVEVPVLSAPVPQHFAGAHIAVKEALAGTLVATHAFESIRAFGLFGRRVWFVGDNAAVQYMVSKGRSSVWALNQQGRRLAMLQLATDSSLVPLYVPSALNPADKHSRHFDS